MSNLLKSKFFLGALVAVFALVGFSKAQAYTHTVTLKMGANNAQVMELQKTLNMTACKVAASGVGSMGMESSYFGGLTSAAVKCFQAANGLTADGVVGPMTGAKLAMVTGSTGGTTTGGTTGCPAGAMYNYMTGALCSGSTGGSTSTGSTTLEGGAGSVESYEIASDWSNEEVGEDAEDVKVAGLEIEASEDSDLMITAVKLVFDEGTAASDFEDYAAEVSVWMNGEEYARVDGSSFNDNNNWTKTVSLDDGAIIKAGDTETLVVAVSGISNLDSADATDTWTVDFTQVRFEDAEEVVTTDSVTTNAVTFSFESFGTAADTELKITEADEDVNDAHVIQVDTSDDTDNVELLSFNIEIEGDSDVLIDSLPVNITTTETTGDDPDDLISVLYLYADGEKIGTESLSTADGNGSTEEVVFDNLDFTIDAGDEVEFTVKAKLYSTADTLDDGDTIAVTFGETETDDADFDAEDESGEDLSDASKTGTVAGEASTVYDTGFTFELVSTDADTTFNADPATAGSADVGTFTHVFKLTAFGGNITIDRSCEEGGADAADQGVEYQVTNSGSNASTCSLTSTAADNTNDSGAAWLLEEGQTKTFTLTTAVTASADHFAKIYLESINWDDDVTDTSPDLYFSAGLGEQKTSTSQLYLNFI